MNKYLKIFLILFCVGLLSGIGVYIYVFHKPHTNLENVKPVFSFDSEKLLNEFKSNTNAHNLYFDQESPVDTAIEVSGTVGEINLDNGVAIITLGDSENGVECSFDSVYVANNKPLFDEVQKGKEIKIKGKYDSFIAEEDIIEIYLVKMSFCVFSK